MAPFLPPRNLFPLIFLGFLNITVCCAELSPVGVSCQDDRTYSENSTYQANLNTLFSNLRNQSSSTGFYNATAGVGSDKTYGLFLCRGDVSGQACQDCVVNATQTLVDQFCGYKREAIFWYEECMVRYSDRWIFSILEKSPRSPYIIIEPPGSPNGTDFRQELVKRVESLVNSTCSVESRTQNRYYQNIVEQNTYNSELPFPYNISFQAQATPDLTQEDCRKCLRTLTDKALGCCRTKLFFREFLPSCQLTYRASFDKSDSRDLKEHREVIQRIVVPIVTLVFLRLWNMP